MTRPENVVQDLRKDIDLRPGEMPPARVRRGASSCRARARGTPREGRPRRSSISRTTPCGPARASVWPARGRTGRFVNARGFGIMAPWSGPRAVRGALKSGR